MRRFVIIGQTASASSEFSLEDLPSSSGRLDVLLRCVRAALLVSHGLRRSVTSYLVLGGGASAPRVLRIAGACAKFLRPDERSLAILMKKALAAQPTESALALDHGFTEVRPGIAVAAGGIERVLNDLGPAHCYLLEESGTDLRACPIASDPVFFIGDHLGFDARTRSRLFDLGARAVSVGPVSLHSEDVVSVLSNELDRLGAE